MLRARPLPCAGKQAAAGDAVQIATCDADMKTAGQNSGSAQCQACMATNTAGTCYDMGVVTARKWQAQLQIQCPNTAAPRICGAGCAKTGFQLADTTLKACGANNTACKATAISAMPRGAAKDLMLCVLSAQIKNEVPVKDAVGQGGIPLACDASVAPAFGKAGNCTSKLQPGTNCQPTCDRGYVVSGVSTCSAQAQLTAASCIQATCANGKITRTTCFCNPGFSGGE
jgi:hypothetical protein|eukprot:COSAG01_NODE_11738_length_1869_cov_5.924294_1_plen_228_part_00